jgi:hypothetical protein
VDGSVEAGDDAGLMVGFLDQGELHYCYAYGTVKGLRCLLELLGFTDESGLPECRRSRLHHR